MQEIKILRKFKIYSKRILIWKKGKVRNMKGIIQVNRLNKSGLFVSEMDWDDCYKSKNNPKGNFVMIIEPLNGWDKGIIYYEKIGKGYLVEGEGYIIEDCVDIIKERVKEWKRKYKKKPFDYVETKLK